MQWRRRLVMAMVAGALAVGVVAAAGDTPEQDAAKDAAKAAAGKAADAWLAVIDRGDYSVSWDQSSESFKSQVTREKWIGACQKVRQPLGKMKTRKFKGALYSDSMPDAPPGKYVMVQFASSFDAVNAALETVVMALEKDGKWRQMGYSVSPS